MMDFEKLDLKESYDSVEDKIVEEFLVPLLQNSRKYYRTTGYFASSALAIAARGLFPFIEKGGHMKIISGIVFNKKDIKAIRDGLLRPEEIIEKYILKELESMKNGEIKDRVKLLAWMVATNHLEIKIALRLNPNLNYEDYEISSFGLFHQKVGIFIDEQNKIISFSGSINETKSGWVHNIEEFKVFKDWIDCERKYVQSDLNKFHRYWDNKISLARTYTIPEAAKRKLIDLAPKDLEQLRHLDSDKKKRTDLILWDHQEHAIKIFIEKKSGILRMAPGTGKTITALTIMRTLIEENKIRGIIISTVGNDLLKQWYNLLLQEFRNKYKILRHFEKYKDIQFFNEFIKNEIVIIAVSYQNLTKLIDATDKDLINKCLLICDEVHNIGSEQKLNSLKGKIKQFSYKLGLSATPIRPYDIEGNEFIFDEIGSEIFHYDMENAIRDGILSELEYYPLFYNLSQQDKDGIRNSITNFHARKKTENPMSDTELYRRIANTKKLSMNKLPIFKEFLEKNSQILKKCIIFVQTKDYGLDVQKIVLPHDDNFRTYYSEDQEENLDLFRKKQIDCLITCRKIAEGIDIRSIENIVLFSSSRSDGEIIQRVGRSLRKDPDNPNKRAHIVDLVCQDDLKKPDKEYEASDLKRFKWLQELSLVRRKKA